MLLFPQFMRTEVVSSMGLRTRAQVQIAGPPLASRARSDNFMAALALWLRWVPTSTQFGPFPAPARWVDGSLFAAVPGPAIETS